MEIKNNLFLELNEKGKKERLCKFGIDKPVFNIILNFNNAFEELEISMTNEDGELLLFYYEPRFGEMIEEKKPTKEILYLADEKYIKICLKAYKFKEKYKNKKVEYYNEYVEFLTSLLEDVRNLDISYNFKSKIEIYQRKL